MARSRVNGGAYDHWTSDRPPPRPPLNPSTYSYSYTYTLVNVPYTRAPACVYEYEYVYGKTERREGM